MLFKKLLFVFISFSFSSAISQNFDLGKVSVEELQEKEHPTDPSAPAAILFKKGVLDFNYSKEKGFEMFTKVQTRIKIYNKQGYEWANQQVRYYIGSTDTKEIVNFSNAVTYNLEGGKIVKTKLKSDGEFDNKINKYWGQKKISLPNVKEGSVIEFEYIVKSPNITTIDKWDFQMSIPVNYSEFRTNIPEYFVYNPNQKGFVYPKKVEHKIPKSFNIVNKQENNDGAWGSRSNSSYSNDKIDYIETQTTYTAENFPAMKEESFVNNIDNYTSSIIFELAMTRFPNQAYKTYSTDWESVVKTIYDNEDFGAELNKTGYFEADIDAILKGLTTQEERMTAIFNYVKSKVKWNDYNGYQCDQGVKNAYKNGTGNIAEINLMLTAMLRYAGFSANPVLLSTRSNGIAVFPNRTAFNYVISAVEIQDDVILLDASEKFAMPNVLPLRDLNWFGRLIRKNGTSVQIDLTPKKVSREIATLSYTFNGSDAFEGKYRRTLTDYEAMNFREQYSKMTTDAYLEVLERQNNDIEINDYIRDNEQDASKPLVETYSFRDAKSIEIINDEIYITPQLFMTAKENPFKMEGRNYPVDFSYPMQNKINITIEVPEGYMIASLPKAMNILTGNDIGAFKYNILDAGKLIQVVLTADIMTPIVSSDYYDTLKEFFQQMVNKENEKIVLKKI